MSAYEHGARAFWRGKHLQANPFDYMSQEWREWRTGWCYAGQPKWTAYDYNGRR